MRCRVLTLPATLALIALAAPAIPSGEAAIASATVRFRESGRSPAAKSVRATLKLRGDLFLESALPAFDPVTDRLAVTLGPETLVDATGLPAGARLKERRDGRWTLRLRRPFGPRSGLRITMARASGIFTLKVRGMDGGALLADGPGGVPFAMTLGDRTWHASLPFSTGRGERWTYDAPFPHKPPPGTGGGGGGGGSGGGGGGGGGPVAVNFSTLEQGQFTPINAPTFGVYRDTSSWKAIWVAHKWGIVAPPPAPLLDWTKEMYVGVWIGGRPNGGYTATITKVEVDGSAITVHVTEQQPGANCVVPSVTTSPYHIIRMPRVDGTAQQKLKVTVVNCP
jgi:hypothetical protein